MFERVDQAAATGSSEGLGAGAMLCWEAACTPQAQPQQLQPPETCAQGSPSPNMYPGAVGADSRGWQGCGPVGLRSVRSRVKHTLRPQQEVQDPLPTCPNTAPRVTPAPPLAHQRSGASSLAQGLCTCGSICWGRSRLLMPVQTSGL